MAISSALQTPSKLPPPPRQLRRRKEGRFGAVFLLLFISIFLVISGVLVGRDLLLSFTAENGKPISATITNKRAEVHHDKHGTSYSYWVDFTYTFSGQNLQDKQRLTDSAYDDADIGQQVPGKAMQIGSWPICVIDLPRSRSDLVSGLIMLAFSAILGGIFGAIAIRKRNLVRDGTPAVGVVIGRRMVRGKSARYYVSYRFSTSDGTALEKEMTVQKKYYEQSPEGTQVTVLYDPVNPRRSLAYECGDYEVVPLVG